MGSFSILVRDNGDAVGPCRANDGRCSRLFKITEASRCVHNGQRGGLLVNVTVPAGIGAFVWCPKR